MDPILAELYGTDELVKEAAEQDTQEEEISIEEYLAKEAADAFVEWASEEGIDLSKEAEEDIESSYAEFADGFIKAAAAEMSKEAGDESGEDAELQEKLAEADTLGRVMAHAYVQELAGIDKEAGAVGSFWRHLTGKNVKELAKRTAHPTTAADMAQASFEHAVQKELGGMSPTRAAVSEAVRKLKRKGISAPSGVHPMTPELEKAIKNRNLARGATAAVGGAGAAGVAGGAGAGYMAGKEKKGEYYEAVGIRAAELLKEAGYSLEDTGAQEEEEKIAYELERDALQLLEANGFPVEWADNE